MAPTGRVQQGHYEVNDWCTCKTMQLSLALQAVQHKLAKLSLAVRYVASGGGQGKPGDCLHC